MSELRQTEPDGTTPGSPGYGIRVRVRGIVQGRELDAYAMASLSGHAVVMAWENATPWRLDLDGLDGLMPQPQQLLLYLASGDVLELSESDDLRSFATRLTDRACEVPELTRGLRALGSTRGSQVSAHDRWFAPLLSARRSVAGISDPSRQVTLVDAASIAQQLRRVIAQLADEHAAGQAAMRRAIDAALEQESEEVFVALERLALTADVLRISTPDTRLVDWRRWVGALRDVFIAADQCWPRCALVLTHGV